LTLKVLGPDLTEEGKLQPSLGVTKIENSIRMAGHMRWHTKFDAPILDLRVTRA
jgi:hypothetical protein